MSKLVQNYLLQQSVGKGVYGKVYRAIHQKTKLEYAVKVIPKSVFQANPKLQQLAINEIKILSSLKNDHIVRFVQTLKTPNNFYFVYEYCNDGTLDSLLSKKKLLQEQQALKILAQLIQAFKQLNKNSVMHRDLKPDNIFLSNGKVKLGDFGFCKMLQVNMAQTMLGSPIYMAPQILRQQIYTSKADIWSLGVVLFEMLFGYCPFESSSISQLINVLKQNQLLIPEDINQISPQTRQLLEKMLIKDQFKRIQWVDLFEYKIDEEGHMICPNKKDYMIENLENYFLFNNVSYNGKSVMQVNPTSQTQIKTSQSPKKFNSSFKSIPKDQYKKQQQSPAKLKRITSNNANQSISQFSSHQSYKQQQTNSDKVISYNPIPQPPPSLSTQVQIGQEKKNYSNINKNSKNNQFQYKHEAWLKGVQLMDELINKPNNFQYEQLIYWMMVSLFKKINKQYTLYPTWSDVLIEQKKVLTEAFKQFNMHSIKYKDPSNNINDGKNQVLKMWKKACLNDISQLNLWQQAIKFMYCSENQNQNLSTQQILLT